MFGGKKMKKFHIKDLARIIRAHSQEDLSRTLRAASHGSFIRVNTDSRTIKTGDCFFALTGDIFDGHNYIEDAFAKGAVCAVVSRDIESVGNCLLKVPDTVKALGDFAAEFRRLMNFKVIAITGSVGKTTVRQIIYHVLSRRYRVYQSPKNFNNQIGVPLTLLGAGSEHEIVITELGTNHPGEIAYLTAIAQPNIAVVTNVCLAHLEGLGSIDAIAEEKLSISQGLIPDGVLIINSAITPPAELSAKILTFGKSDTSDFRAKNISLEGAGSRFVIDGVEVCLPLAGLGNIENALAAWAVCNQFGITVGDFTQAVKTLSAAPMRAEVLQFGTLTVLNDCYNANPASMKNALNILASLTSKDKRRAVFICGDMAELGQYTQDLHADLGVNVARAEVQLLLTVGESAKIVADSAKGAAKYDLQTKSFTDALSACNNLIKFIKDYDIVLVKGSRINKLELTVEKLKELFS
jgi:UDP-N-acetylmuramoyl-tripeptide--D-alanyl-D-alanine ligase